MKSSGVTVVLYPLWRLLWSITVHTHRKLLWLPVCGTIGENKLSRSWIVAGNSLNCYFTNFYFAGWFRSEHERHSPNCPFVRGECTENVPLSGRHLKCISWLAFSICQKCSHFNNVVYFAIYYILLYITFFHVCVL